MQSCHFAYNSAISDLFTTASKPWEILFESGQSSLTTASLFVSKERTRTWVGELKKIASKASVTLSGGSQACLFSDCCGIASTRPFQTNLERLPFPDVLRDILRNIMPVSVYLILQSGRICVLANTLLMGTKFSARYQSKSD